MFGKDITEKNVGKDILSILIRLHTQHVQDWRGVRIWYNTPFFFISEFPLLLLWDHFTNNYHIFLFYKEIICKIVSLKF